MKLGKAILIVVATLALCASTALAGTVGGWPDATLWIDGDSVAVPGAAWSWNSVDNQWEMDGYSWSTPEGEINISGAFVPDPMIIYTFGVTDFGAPSTFTFAVSQPIVPTGPLTTVQASISGGLNDATGNGVTFTPNPANGDPDFDTFTEAQVNRVGPGAVPTTDMGVDVGLSEFHIGSGPGANYTYGSYGAGPQPGPVGIWNSLGITTSFTLSGGNDAVSLTGFASINTVPEPSTFVLLGCAAGGLFAFRRRRGR